MKKRVILAISLIAVYILVSAGLLMRDGVQRTRATRATTMSIEADLKSLYQAAVLYKQRKSNYPDGMTELVEALPVHSLQWPSTDFSIHPTARGVEALIEYVGSDTRIRHYKVLECGIVTRANITLK